MKYLGNKIKLIKTHPQDINRIVQFEKDNRQFVGQYTHEQHKKLLQDKDCIHLCIKKISDNQIVGHLLLFGLISIDKTIEFRRIVINNKGLGYGKEAILLLKQLCFEKLQANSIWLDVYNDNSHAISLYESTGFIYKKIIDTERPQRIYLIDNQNRT